MTWQTELVEAIREAFEPTEFDRFISDLEKSVTDYAPQKVAFPEVAKAVVSGAAREEWHRQLIRDLLFRRPRTFQVFRRAHPDLAPTWLTADETDELVAGLTSAFQDYAQLAALVEPVAF